MTPLYSAVATLDFVRARHIQSSNKYPHLERSSLNLRALQAQQKRWVDTLDAVRDRVQTSRFRGHQILLHHARETLAARVGNCGELTAVCIWYLLKRGSQNFCYATFPEDDHAFVALGQPHDIHGNLPRNFADWHPDAAVCDAWADIACAARDYPARWRARMNNWHIMHLDVDGEDPHSADLYNLAGRPKSVIAAF